MQNAFESLVAKLRSSRAALWYELGPSQGDVAERAILTLAEQGMSPDDLLERVVRSHWPDQLLRYLFLAQILEAREHLIDAMMESLELQKHTETVVLLLGGSDSFDYVWKKHRPALFDPDHYLFRRISADLWWRWRMDHFLAREKPDYARAYDILWKAYRGFASPEDREEVEGLEASGTPRPGEPLNVSHRLYRASVRCLELMIIDLHRRMVQARLVTERTGGWWLSASRPATEAFIQCLDQRLCKTYLATLDDHFRAKKREKGRK